MNTARSLALAILLVSLAGCTSYYEVKDPTTGKTYYSSEYDQGRDGQVTLTDEGSGASVTIQNSEIREISKDEFKEKAYMTDEPEPAPAPEPAAPAEPAAAPAE